MGGGAKHFLLTSLVKIIGTEGLVYFFSGSLALAREKARTSVSLRIGKSRYFPRSKFNVGVLMLYRKERKNSVNSVNEFSVSMFVKH